MYAILHYPNRKNKVMMYHSEFYSVPKFRKNNSSVASNTEGI